VIAAGTCAVYGGIPAADNNPTSAAGLPAFLKREKISKFIAPGVLATH
jgi:hydrogenase small subunit